ncbi:hypothetical protein SCLCIDRAFT_673525 [Scleroderma citrinum Foug A]|uniref:Uncharacterized protein n=1 Tax=Scleroderma citrinum Foug A TaxID=1036808 RepID=A0A0C3AG67_9AGAM|nr:hypothetical protein SCLCIDRAFT_673525 [Scleroderma citrinum Foug A]
MLLHKRASTAHPLHGVSSNEPIGYEAVSTEKVGDGEEALRGAEAAEPSEITPLLRVHVKIYPFQRGVSGQFAGGYYNYWSQCLSL